MKIAHAGVSDQGRVRFRNEDFIAHRQPEDPETRERKGALFVLCDGVGGSGAGDVASKEAAQTLVTHYYESRRPPERALREAFERANLHVYDLQLTSAASSRMQTTMSAMALVGNRVHIAHVGDSRIYRFRAAPPGAGDAEDELLNPLQLTTDHSEVAELVKMQILTQEMVRTHPRRNIITRSLGSQPVVRGQFATEVVAAGDIFLQCSDGLWEPVRETDMAELLHRRDLEESCARMVALALERGTTDNVSVQVAQVLELSELPESTGADLAQKSGSWFQRLFKRV